MYIIPVGIQNLIEEFSKLPGVGPKSAERLTFYLLRGAKRNIEGLGQAILDLKDNLLICNVCSNIADADPCVLCCDDRRERDIVCVVEEPLDILALEKTSKFKGLYHVLHGAISPVDGIGPDDLYIKHLLTRIQNNPEIKEIIIATNSSLEGETTAMYLSKLIHPLNVKITRIANGLPIGSEIEYADEITLSRALEGRREY